MIIKDFTGFSYKGYVHKRTKHEPTDSYFYPERQLAKCMMRADALNQQVEPVRTEMTGKQQIKISQICDSNESKSKGIIADEKLLKFCSMDKGKPESVIIDESSMEESE